jgi:hypothetical protein
MSGSGAPCTAFKVGAPWRGDTRPARGPQEGAGVVGPVVQHCGCPAAQRRAQPPPPLQRHPTRELRAEQLRQPPDLRHLQQQPVRLGQLRTGSRLVQTTPNRPDLL